MLGTMEKNTIRIRLALSMLGALAGPALADNAAPKTPFGDPMFPQQSGEDIYKGVCQGCHMPDAKGAVGAGMYPALAKNKNLETAAYPVSIILHGQKAMPALGDYFTDEQVANVVNYVRGNFGNHYRDKVKPADVKLQR
jgi:mono/diheme cytochrome c family protein